MNNPKVSLKKLFSNKKFLFILGLGLALNIIIWVLFWLGLDFDKTALILHYNSFFGIDKIAVNSEERRFIDVFFAPIGGLLVMFINFLLGCCLIHSSQKKRIERKENSKRGELSEISTAALGGWFIFLAGVIFQLVILIYAVAIFFVNK